MAEAKLPAIKFLEGKRVYLRPYQPEDIELVYRSTYQTESRKLTGTQRLFSSTQIEQFTEKAASDNSRVDLVIVQQETDEAVGEVVLNFIDAVNRSANIRIGLFDQRHFNKGYGSEAMSLMLEYGFGYLNLHRIELGVYAFNPRALHVYEKLGFKKEGVRRDMLYYNHRYVDEIVMSILEDEYRALRQPDNLP